jgi:hypothetical protein
MALPDFIAQTYSKPLSASEVARRRVEWIEDLRKRHEIALQFPNESPKRYRDGGPLHDNQGLTPRVAPSLLGAPSKDGVFREEDFRCPFCPPYNLPLDANIKDLLDLPVHWQFKQEDELLSSE